MSPATNSRNRGFDDAYSQNDSCNSDLVFGQSVNSDYADDDELAQGLFGRYHAEHTNRRPLSGFMKKIGGSVRAIQERINESTKRRKSVQLSSAPVPESFRSKRRRRRNMIIALVVLLSVIVIGATAASTSYFVRRSHHRSASDGGDGNKLNSVSYGPGDVEVYCSPDNLLTEEGRSQCDSACSGVPACCYSWCMKDYYDFCSSFFGYCDHIFISGNDTVASVNQSATKAPKQPAIPAEIFSKAPKDLDQMCSKDNKDTTYCIEQCKPALCCVVPNIDNSTISTDSIVGCYEGNEDICDGYEPCVEFVSAILASYEGTELQHASAGTKLPYTSAGTEQPHTSTGTEQPHTSTGTEHPFIPRAPADINEKCSIQGVNVKNLLSCAETCKVAKCCIGYGGSENCFQSNKKNCQTYAICIDIFKKLKNVVEEMKSVPFPQDDVSFLCNRKSMMRDRTPCENACKPAKCCFDSRDENCFQENEESCVKYAACLALSEEDVGVEMNPEETTDADDTKSLLAIACAQENIATKEGFMVCEVECEPGRCCFDDGEEGCFSADNLDFCKEYVLCRDIRN